MDAARQNIKGGTVKPISNYEEELIKLCVCHKISKDVVLDHMISSGTIENHGDFDTWSRHIAYQRAMSDASIAHAKGENEEEEEC